MGRVRQMAKAGRLWVGKVTERATVFDAKEVAKLARIRQEARDAGILPGARPGGFKAN